MDKNREILKKQIGDAYGRVLYSYYTHENQASINSTIHETMRWMKIIASAVSPVALIVLNALPKQCEVATLWVSAIAAVIVTAFEAIMRELALDKKCAANHVTGNALCGLRESYESLYIDSMNESISLDYIKSKRDELQLRAQEVYSVAPRTWQIAYNRAERFIKNGGHVFSNAELHDTILAINDCGQEGDNNEPS